LTTSATPESSSGAHHHEHEVAGPAITAQGLREHAATHAAAAASAGTGAVPDVHINGVTKRFGDVVAVDDMELEVSQGSFYSFLGPSGCGKTTTLRMIAGFEQPTSGEIYLGGEPVAGVPPYRRHVNTVFQHYALFPHMNVAQNVGYGLRQKGISKHDEQHRVGEALELVRLAGYGTRRTWELSGGQQQRVALARALVNHPSVLLLDEPLGALDRKLRHEMQIELKQLQQEVGITFVYVTHDQEEALTMSDVIIVMNHGRIQQQGDPITLYQHPVNRFVAGFIGSSNFIDGTLAASDPASGRAHVTTASGVIVTGRLTDRSATPPRGTGVTVAVRPERLRVRAADSLAGTEPTTGGVTGRVTQGTYLGDQTEFRVATDSLGELIARKQNTAADGASEALGPGAQVVVDWHEDDVLVLAS
jgi:spermidine/putrescine transport system ATP-binding protein